MVPVCRLPVTMVPVAGVVPSFMMESENVTVWLPPAVRGLILLSGLANSPLLFPFISFTVEVEEVVCVIVPDVVIRKNTRGGWTEKS